MIEKQKDLLKREDFIREQSFNVKQALDNGGCMAFTGSWGTGKSWLCDNFIYQIKEGFLEEQFKGVQIVKIDASLYSHHPEPFIPIFEEFSKTFEEKGGIVSRLKELKNIVLPFLRRAIQSISDIDLEPVLKGLESDALSVDDQIRSYKQKISECVKDHPVLFFIDELDRCTPDFALKFLDRIRHYFTIPQIGFVIFVNVEQLSKFIKHIFGDEDGMAYLEKFIPLGNFVLLPDLFNRSHQYPDQKLLYSLYRENLKEEAKEQSINMTVFLSEALFKGNLRKDLEVIAIAKRFYDLNKENLKEGKIDSFDFYMIHLRTRDLEIFRLLINNQIAEFVARERPHIDQVNSRHQDYKGDIKRRWELDYKLLSALLDACDHPNNNLPKYGSSNNHIFSSKFEFLQTGDELISAIQSFYRNLLTLS